MTVYSRLFPQQHLLDVIERVVRATSWPLGVRPSHGNSSLLKRRSNTLLSRPIIPYMIGNTGSRPLYRSQKSWGRGLPGPLSNLKFHLLKSGAFPSHPAPSSFDMTQPSPSPSSASPMTPPCSWCGPYGFIRSGSPITLITHEGILARRQHIGKPTQSYKHDPCNGSYILER